MVFYFLSGKVFSKPTDEGKKPAKADDKGEQEKLFNGQRHGLLFPFW
jgi:hypothetical protein